MKLGFERFTVVLAVVVLAGLGAGLTAPAAAAVAPPGWGRLAQTPEGGSSGVLDTVGAGVHAAAVEELWDLGVFEGTECASGGFCWGEPVLREVAAVWIVRVVDGGDGEVAAGGSRFADVDPDGLWAGHVERLAELRVTVGCAVDPARFCPGVQVSRAQMASFLVRAFGLEPAGEAGFGDTAGSGHGGDIDALLAAGVTLGCSADPLLFCPDHLTTRAQMATFLNRARVLGEDPGDSDSSGADGSGSGGSGDTADYHYDTAHYHYDTAHYHYYGAADRVRGARRGAERAAEPDRGTRQHLVGADVGAVRQ